MSAETTPRVATAKPISCTRIVTPGHEGWGNLIYDGPDGYLCFAMVPPAVAGAIEKLIAMSLSGQMPDPTKEYQAADLERHVIEAALEVCEKRSNARVHWLNSIAQLEADNAGWRLEEAVDRLVEHRAREKAT